MAIETKPRGQRMRISSGTPGVMPVQTVTETAQAEAPKAAAPAASSALQSSVLQPAMQAMKEMPDFDHAKVAMLRDALAKGELPFNASKLAGVIQRFHGGQ
ncbi:flagellar biosynthesis anti-sigma factor FlgM [Pseudoduganella lutea]|jgi:negative regulator of flagellin synthesis FlgM|uniref:Negative regulator of flagellin synthesis n=1 Tax=Pseudoduganella lutea TaxID=321985 RepID=A0A4P6L2A0_9BURK|nr:flagellar biosynthesis anti-sigma factor FlgM [Pseudoduganella lutea]QBE65640.1 flagellar biosynthesis anti-sigma factor FlgM [Pseudoduganella lutea]